MSINDLEDHLLQGVGHLRTYGQHDAVIAPESACSLILRLETEVTALSVEVEWLKNAGRSE